RVYYNLGNTQFRLGEKAEDWGDQKKRWEAAVRSYLRARDLRTNDVDASFNLQFVQQRLDELNERIRRLEEDRAARRLAEEEAEKKRRYHRALEIIQARKQKNPESKELDDFIQRLGEIDEIANPKQP